MGTPARLRHQAARLDRLGAEGRALDLARGLLVSRGSAVKMRIGTAAEAGRAWMARAIAKPSRPGSALSSARLQITSRIRIVVVDQDERDAPRPRARLVTRCVVHGRPLAPREYRPNGRKT